MLENDSLQEILHVSSFLPKKYHYKFFDILQMHDLKLCLIISLKTKRTAHSVNCDIQTACLPTILTNS